MGCQHLLLVFIIMPSKKGLTTLSRDSHSISWKGQKENYVINIPILIT